ncbi:hypothetical protein FSY45_24770 [Comamonas sp. Z1]|uniref:hypothetical protein n=1 Tax=Comamonas TaxID=283 RepID=UPI0011E703B2|nr:MULTISPECIES: hypothetical protein [Comamonas]TYK70280.1 hypothetical protein FSY45_24770 [Comamonas sp. Z1]UBQ44583.1 hypothetical protein LCH15_26200 [Comamonas thiooxydans]
MATWDNWMPELQLAAPTAPVPLIHLCLNRAARDFCANTRAWQVWLDPVQATGDATQEYGLDLPMGAEVVRLEAATLDGKPLEVVMAMDTEGDPVAMSRLRGLVCTDLQNFYLPSGQVGAVRVKCTLQPTISASTVPDLVASRFFEALRDGALSELLAKDNTDFFKPELAAVHLERFNQAKNTAQAAVWRNHGTRGGGARKVGWC